MTTVFGDIGNEVKFNSPSKRNSVLHVEEALSNDEEGFSFKLSKVEAKNTEITVSDVSDQNSLVDSFDAFLTNQRKILPQLLSDANSTESRNRILDSFFEKIAEQRRLVAS